MNVSSRGRILCERTCYCGATFRVGTWGPEQRFCSRECHLKVWTSNVVHGHGSRQKGISPEYQSWKGMKARCEQPCCASYKRYGAVGVTVCERWSKSFTAFLGDMGLKPTPRHTIERLDNARGYEPSNCRWVTPKEQAQNRKRPITRNGRPFGWVTEAIKQSRTDAARTMKRWTQEELDALRTFDGHDSELAKVLRRSMKAIEIKRFKTRGEARA